jgi:hypothetical protein
MSHDKIKAAARKRMATTGESYAVARREVIKEHAAAEAGQFRLAPGIAEIMTAELPEPAWLRTAAAFGADQLAKIDSLTPDMTEIMTASLLDMTEIMTASLPDMTEILTAADGTGVDDLD